MKTKFIVLITTLLLVLASCDRPNCKNTNPIFDSNSIDSKAYKKELVKEVERVGMENLLYWFSGYSKQNEHEYITVFVQGDNLCAQAILQVKDWKNIEGIKRTKGKSYRGVELKGLTFDIVATGDSISFIYKNLKRIID